MPAILLERLPLPSLHTYISFSFLILALATFYAHQTVRAKVNFDPQTQAIDEVGLPPELENVTLPYGNDEHFMNLIHVMTVEPWCIWTIVNSCYCLLILLGKVIQRLVFGELRVIEQQHVKDRFWNFVFYKFIFIFGVMNVQSMEQVVLWVAWFTALGFFHLLTQLSQDRFEYLSFSPATPWIAHIKLLSLLVVILISCGFMMAVCVWFGVNISFTIFAFLAAECLLLLLKCLYVVVRYIIQLREMNMEGVWEGRAIYVYYTELTFELTSLSVDFGHHLHMLLHGNIFLSMASLVICMQLRYLFYEFQRRIKRHKNYLRVVKDMESKFQMATQEDLEQNADDCAICWEKMEVARKLPCGHLFHNSCLRSWLEQDTSCPTCRTALSEQSPETGRRINIAQPEAANAMDPIGVVAPNTGMTNHFFHFDGSRYVSWLPSFSVEVTHTNLLPGQQAHATQTSQLDNMAREVQGVFPNVPASVIMEDLRLTRSIDLTIDNILEGRVNIPPIPLASQSDHQRNDSHSSVSSTSSEISTSVSSFEQSNVNLEVPGRSDSQALGHPLPDLQQSPSQSAEASQSSPAEDIPLSGASAGGRFSKSASERMVMLEQRKLVMFEQARRRYQTRQEREKSAMSVQETESLSSSADFLDQTTVDQNDSESNERARRRAVVLEATQRRLERV